MKHTERKRYTPADEEKLFALMEEEGEAWQEIWGEGRERYKAALAKADVFVVYQDDILCGFIRAKDDDGFGVYIYDLLVRKPSRGQNLGRALIDEVCKAYPRDTVYVMSDVDPYYAKQGITHREGSVLTVQSPGD